LKKHLAIIPLLFLSSLYLCVIIEIQPPQNRDVLISTPRIQPTSFDAGDYIGLDNLSWGQNLTGNGVTVAVLDTGIYEDHSAFTDDGALAWNERIIAFYNHTLNTTDNSPEDIEGHGTWAASILGGNCTDYQGVAPDVKFVIMEVFEDDGGEIVSSLAILDSAINWLITNKDTYNVSIASMSFGAKLEDDNIDEIKALEVMVKKLMDAGVLVVTAAGNYGNGNIMESVTSPGSDKSVLTVGGVDYEGDMFSASGKGPTHEGTIKPDVCAPADSVKGAKSGVLPNNYVYKDGTSASTPFVSGLAALMLEKRPDLSALEMKNIICLTSYRTIDPRIIKDNIQGWGIVQGYAALDALDSPIPVSQDTIIDISLNENYSVYCQPITLEFGHYFFELTQLGSGESEMYLFDSVPDIYGNPVLLSKTINDFISFDPSQTIGAFSLGSHNFYLVVKLVEGTGSGNFRITLIFDFRLGIIVALSAVSILAMVYIIRQYTGFQKIRV